MKEETQRVLDREALKGKSYEERVKLLRGIGRNYNVKIYPAKDGKNTKDVAKCVMVRECPTHGKIEVKLAAFVTRGNFGCHLCIRELQAEMTRKPDNLKSGVTKYAERKVYLAVSECGDYLKVGATAGEPERRVKQVTAVAPIRFTRYCYVNTSGDKSSVLEQALKITLGKHTQTDLGKFPGSGEIVSLKSVGMTAEQLRLRIKHLEGKGRDMKLTKEDVAFSKFEKVWYKSDEVAARKEAESAEFKTRLLKDIAWFIRHRVSAANDYYADSYVDKDYEERENLAAFANRDAEFDISNLVEVVRTDPNKTSHTVTVGEKVFEVSLATLRFGPISDIVLAVVELIPKHS